MDFSKVGQRIREQRQKNNITIESLAEQTNLSILHIGHIERGHRKPSLDTIIKIAQILNVSLDYLLYGDIEKKGLERQELEGLLSKCSKNDIQFLVGVTRLILKKSGE